MACSDRKSRGELLSTAEVQRSATKSDGMCSLYLFQFLQAQRTDHLPIDRVSHTREPPDVVNSVCLPFMMNTKLNTRGGVHRIKVPYQVLFGQEYLAHTGSSFQGEKSVASFVSSTFLQT